MNDFRNKYKSDLPDKISKLKQINESCINLFRDFPSSDKVRNMRYSKEITIKETVSLSFEAVHLYQNLNKILKGTPTMNREDVSRNDQFAELYYELTKIESVYRLCGDYMSDTNGGYGINGILLQEIADRVEKIIHEHEKQQQDNIANKQSRDKDDDDGERGGTDKPREKSASKDMNLNELIVRRRRVH